MEIKKGIAVSPGIVIARGLVIDSKDYHIPRRSIIISQRAGEITRVRKAFAEAMLLADDDAVRARVEKASICAYRMAIEDVYTWDDKKGPLPPEIAQRTRPYVKRMFELCDKYGVTHFTEGLTIGPRTDRPFPGYRSIFRKRFGLKEGESF